MSFNIHNVVVYIGETNSQLSNQSFYVVRGIYEKNLFGEPEIVVENNLCQIRAYSAANFKLADFYTK